VSINLVGPIVLLLCIIIRLFLNLHIIHFRNPWTFFKGVATIVTSVEAGIAMAALSSITVGTYKLSSDYDSGPRINNRVKNTWDFHVQGVVRHSIEDENMYCLLKKNGVDLPLEDIREYKSRIISGKKIHYELSFGHNSSELDKLSPSDLKTLGCVDLIPEKELLRHNLRVCQGIGSKSLTPDSYIYQYDKHERENFSVLGIDPPSAEALHSRYKLLTIDICKTVRGQEDLEKFLDGKSDKVFNDFKDGREFGSVRTHSETYKRILSQISRSNHIYKFKEFSNKIPQPKITLDDLNLQEECFDASAYFQEQLKKPLPLMIKDRPENP
jgi:hypothetical protein